jgi:hypothetical protein
MKLQFLLLGVLAVGLVASLEQHTLKGDTDPIKADLKKRVAK